jgi:hypothetical protein|tara:strand:+ start:5684 stop:7048 length:1365 start_codon:yes stop_codon:yes gene_type:complete
MTKFGFPIDLFCLISFSLGYCACLAAEPDDEFMQGFDDFQIDAQQQPVKADRGWQVGGHLALLTSYSYALDDSVEGILKEYAGLSKLQTLLRVHANLQSDRWRIHAEGRGFRDWFYDHRGKSHFPDSVLDEHGSELEWHEFYLQGRLHGNVDIKIGRQLLSWGRSDHVRVLDLLNPLDLREPGSTDIVEIRLPVSMTRLDYSRGAWSWNLIAIHEVRFNKTPAVGSEFQPRLTGPRAEVTPSDEWAAERAFRVRGVFPGWDLSMHYAELYADEPYLDIADPNEPLLRHSWLRVAGLAFDRIYGGWLLKGEYARLSGFNLAADPGHEHSRSDLLLGIEYFGFRDTQIALETSVQHLHGWQSRFALPPDYRLRDEWQSALRLNRSFANDQVSAVMVALLRGSQLSDGGIFRASLEYTPLDGLTLSTGFVLYSKGDTPPLSELGDRDRILLGLKYFF